MWPHRIGGRAAVRTPVRARQRRCGEARAEVGFLRPGQSSAVSPLVVFGPSASVCGLAADAGSGGVAAEPPRVSAPPELAVRPPTLVPPEVVVPPVVGPSEVVVPPVVGAPGVVGRPPVLTLLG